MADRKKYMSEYQRHYSTVKVSFRKGDPDQERMLVWLKNQPNTSAYIKHLIEEDMKKAGR